MNNVKTKSSVKAPSMNSHHRVTEEDGVIVQLVSQMILDAYNSGASDIHIEHGLGEADAVARFNINGKYQEYRTIPYTYKSAVFSRIKRMSYLDVAERSLPQGGKIEFRKYAPLDLGLRVATIPTMEGNEDLVMTLLVTGRPTVVNIMPQ
jgi:type II secretory ATPase GspE/PulE/Tfp pilus assembly ATPase PilB-like protein